MPVKRKKGIAPVGVEQHLQLGQPEQHPFVRIGTEVAALTAQRENQLPGVQIAAINGCCTGLFVIDRIADDGRTDAFQRYPYLMRFTGIGATQKGTQPGLERGAVELGSGKIVALTGQTPTAATAAYHAAFDTALFFSRFVIA